MGWVKKRIAVHYASPVSTGLLKETQHEDER
jgi:hypothetical protein